MSGPVRLAYPSTFLELFMCDYAYIPVYMPKILGEEDHVERLRLLTAALIGGFYCGEFKQLAKRPLNPLLG